MSRSFLSGKCLIGESVDRPTMGLLPGSQEGPFRFFESSQAVSSAAESCPVSDAGLIELSGGLNALFDGGNRDGFLLTRLNERIEDGYPLRYAMRMELSGFNISRQFMRREGIGYRRDEFITIKRFPQHIKSSHAHGIDDDGAFGVPTHHDDGHCRFKAGQCRAGRFEGCDANMRQAELQHVCQACQQTGIVVYQHHGRMRHSEYCVTVGPRTCGTVKPYLKIRQASALH
jgi:hypothetical protein